MNKTLSTTDLVDYLPEISFHELSDSTSKSVIRIRKPKKFNTQSPWSFLVEECVKEQEK